MNDMGTYSDLNVNNGLNRYVTVKEPSTSRCDPGGIKGVVTVLVITGAGYCRGTKPLPMTCADRQEIIFTSADPGVTLDSKATFNFGDPAPTTSPTPTPKGPKVITIVTTPITEPPASLAPLVPTETLAPLVTTEPAPGILNPVNP
jgi:hypothetical protein